LSLELNLKIMRLYKFFKEKAVMIVQKFLLMLILFFLL